jgi:hypothetical protein
VSLPAIRVLPHRACRYDGVMSRFVLLRHECPPQYGKPSHWDLMLEDDGVLLTWRLLELPTPGGPAAFATRLDDHRIAYLDYEGPLSGDRGSVRRVDAGEFRWLEQTDRQLVVSFAGRQIRGTLTARQVGGSKWRFNFETVGDGQ